jgi:hypothetical protein
MLADGWIVVGLGSDAHKPEMNKPLKSRELYIPKSHNHHYGK